MRNIFSSIVVASAIVTSAFATKNDNATFTAAGLDLGFGSYSSITFNPYYEHINDYDNLVYRADFTFQSFDIDYTYGKYEYTHFGIGGLVGKAYYMPIGSFQGGLNVMGGGSYYSFSGKYKSNVSWLTYSDSKYSGFALRGGVKYSGFVTKEIQLSGTAMLNVQFGDISGTYLTTTLEGSYHFTPNLFAHLRIGYDGMGTFDTSYAFIGAGYRF